MSRDELKAKTLRGMSKRCVITIGLIVAPHSDALTGFSGMALGPQLPRAQGERMSKAGDERAPALPRAPCPPSELVGVVRCSSNCRLMWSTNKNIKKLSLRAVWLAGAEASVQCLTVTGCIKGRKHRASPVLLALCRGRLHNCAATSVSPALLLNGSASAHADASWPSAQEEVPPFTGGTFCPGVRGLCPEAIMQGVTS